MKSRKEVIKAVLDGKGDTHIVEAHNPIMKEQYHLNRGQMIQKANQWQRDNPELAKDPAKIKAFFSTFNQGATRTQPGLYE